jgi:hypothetical protein
MSARRPVDHQQQADHTGHGREPAPGAAEQSELSQLVPTEAGAPDLLHIGKRERATSAKSPPFGVLDLAVGPWYTRGSMNA